MSALFGCWRPKPGQVVRLQLAGNRVHERVVREVDGGQVVFDARRLRNGEVLREWRGLTHTLAGWMAWRRRHR